MLLQNGSVYAFGIANCCGQQNDDILSPILVSIPNAITAITCGGYCTIAKCNDQSWYAFGNATNQNAPAYGIAVTAVPSIINDKYPVSETSKEPIQIQKISATMFCFYMISYENELYVAGYNSKYGELGTGNLNNAATWKKRTVESSFVDVQTGWHNSFTLYK